MDRIPRSNAFTVYIHSPIHLLFAFLLALVAVFPAPAVATTGPAVAIPETGFVYAMTNAADGNEIVVYARDAAGVLTLVGSVATGGDGLTTEPDDALGSQNPLIMSPDGKWLFAVNAGSNTISTFRKGAQGIQLVSVTPSGGDFPVSLTMSGNLLYVLNSGGDGNITGFRVRPNGQLTALPGSTRTLGAGGTNPPFFLVSPAQIGFSPDGDWLVVTVKGVNPVHEIHVFDVLNNGRPGATPVTTTSDDTLPFGFAFDRNGNLLVAEPFGNSFDGTPAGELSAASSYVINSNGTLTTISESVANGQTATCWIATTPGGDFAYTTNNGSGTISSYTVDDDGALTLLAEVAANTGAHPVDEVVTADGSFLYTVNAGDGTVSGFSIAADGSLTDLGVIGGLPDDGSAVGIATS